MQVVVDWAFAQGWGLTACWFSTATFMALRLCMNSVSLLRPGSVLSQTTPLSDKMEDLKDKARQLAAAAGSPVSDSEAESEAEDEGQPRLDPGTMDAALEHGQASGASMPSGASMHGRAGGRGRGVSLGDHERGRARKELDSEAPVAQTVAGPGGRCRDPVGGIGDALEGPEHTGP